MAYPTKMRRYKIVACILLMLSVFSSVLAAPIPLAVQEQEVREAYTDSNAVDGGDNVIIEMGKRSGEEDPSVAQAQQEESWFWKVWAPSQHSSSESAPNYASGTSTEIQPLPARPLQTAQKGIPLTTILEGAVAQQNSQAKFKNIFKTILSQLSKLKFWRRISGPTGGV